MTINSIEGVLRVLDAVLAFGIGRPDSECGYDATSEQAERADALRAARAYLATVTVSPSPTSATPEGVCATLTPPAADPAQGAQPVAWLMEQTDYMPGDNSRELAWHPSPHAPGWKQTPLYPHPAPQAESQLRARLEGLVEKWQRRAGVNIGPDGQRLRACADELRATLSETKP